MISLQICPVGISRLLSPGIAITFAGLWTLRTELQEPDSAFPSTKPLAFPKIHLVLLQDEVEINAFTLEMQHNLEKGQGSGHSREKVGWQGTGVGAVRGLG